MMISGECSNISPSSVAFFLTSNTSALYKAIKITRAFIMDKWFDHSCFEYILYGQPYMGACCIMYRLYIFSLTDLISRGFDFEQEVQLSEWERKR